MKKWSLLLVLLVIPAVSMASSWFWTSDYNINQTPGIWEALPGWQNYSQHAIAVPLYASYPKYIVYLKEDAGGWLELFLKRKTAQGWQPEQQLTFNPDYVIHWNEYSIATDPTGQYVYVIYISERYISDGKFVPAVVRSTNYGVTWEVPVYLNNHQPSGERLHYDFPNIVAANNGLVFASWYTGYLYNPPQSIEFAYNINYGCDDDPYPWVVYPNLTPPPTSKTIFPALAVDPNGDYVHVAWKDYATTNEFIKYRRVRKSDTNSGETWNYPLEPHWDPIFDLASWERGQNPEGVTSPAIACSKDGMNKVHVVWSDWRAGTAYKKEVYYKRSIDNGQSWAPVNEGLTRLSNLTSEESKCATISTGSGSMGQIVDFVYLNYKYYPPPMSSTYKPFWRRSWNGGSTWGTQQNISSTGTGNQPWVATDNLDCADFVFPRDNDLWYKRYYCNPCDPLATPGGVEDFNPHLDLKPYDAASPGVRVSPNPVRDEARISFALPGKVADGAVASIYDAQGRLVNSLILDKADSRGAFASWDGKDVSGRRVGNGVYFVSVRHEGKNEVGRLIVAR